MHLNLKIKKPRDNSSNYKRGEHPGLVNFFANLKMPDVRALRRSPAITFPTEYCVLINIRAYVPTYTIDLISAELVSKYVPISKLKKGKVTKMPCLPKDSYSQVNSVILRPNALTFYINVFPFSYCFNFESLGLPKSLLEIFIKL